MKNVKSYFSSWKTLWKSSSNSQTLSLAPSSINFTNSSLGDLKNSIIDENLMIDISTKLMDSASPPKLQVCEHNNQWYALNNSHLLVYRQLERIGLCDKVVCDIIRSQDVPIGIRQTLTPLALPHPEQYYNFQTSQDHYMIMDDDTDAQSHDEVIYCADMQADSCGCLEDEDPCDDSNITDNDSDQDGDSDDEQIEWPAVSPIFQEQISPMNNSRLNEIDLDDDGIEDGQKEMQSLL